MADLKTRLKNDLTVAMKARETVTAGALRMALTAVTNEEVSGKQARELTDDEVVKVLSREAKKRKEAAEAFDGAGRAEKAELERQELAVLETYLPKQLDDAELASIVDKAYDAVAVQLGEAPGQKQMGQVMKAVNAEVAGRAEGGRVAAAVKAKLAG
ncbi:GatB/YqeY domain-containing protein [Lentzea sp. NPDC055074]